MNKKNEFFSFIMDEDITNKQALLAISLFMSIMAIIAFCEVSIPMTIISFLWMIASFWGCYRNGMMDER